MLLYLVRHGAPRSEEEDPARPLSVAGITDVNRVASHLSSYKPARIFHSGKLRAEQTAEIFGEHMGVEVSMAEGLAPMDDPAIWAGRLETVDEDTMLVGHLPHMGRLASLLLCGDPGAVAVEFGQGSVLCLKRQEGRWSLQWMLAPGLVGKVPG